MTPLTDGAEVANAGRLGQLVKCQNVDLRDRRPEKPRQHRSNRSRNQQHRRFADGVLLLNVLVQRALYLVCKAGLQHCVGVLQTVLQQLLQRR